ncbi:D-alanyl-D-alanine carboxypeptidase family protein [Allorhizocola rhizosphaerae]|uniref:D-alanyl-D-alanine carboxypeptidase family protein n=1 Tax=Allorhizocola rhizosphaerae TaxID=1872709 RepID=UPI000E3DD19F|nr:serine hydrolase [Allorhizocola rhizosphaerae]
MSWRNAAVALLCAVTTPVLADASPSPAPAPIPCPKSAEPNPERPPRPSPPPDVPAHRTVGGKQLDSAGLVVPAGVPDPPANTAVSWLVADLDTGKVLGACGPHEYGTPASVQKLLLAATFLDKLDPQQIVTVVHEDIAIPSDSSAVGLVENGQYSVETLWLGLLLQSGNDAANVLARLGGGAGGMAAGVQAMNQHAKWLGAYQTQAVTPSGYDGPGQFTSAYDLALIARVCFANETFRRYQLTERTQIPAQPPKYEGFEIQNENQLMSKYPGAIGGKTGFTSLARHTYVGAAERDGRRLVVTLLGAEPRPQRSWQQGAALLDWGFSLPEQVSVGRLVNPGEPLASPSPSAAPSNPDGPAEVVAAAAESRWTTMFFFGTGLAIATGMTVLAGLVRRARIRRRTDA